MATRAWALTFPVGQLLAQPRQRGPQLGRRHEASLLRVRPPQGLQQLLLWRLLLELLVHDAQQGGEVQRAAAAWSRRSRKEAGGSEEEE